jgi:Phage tail tube protein
MLKTRAVLLAKVEGTYGTDSVPVAATNAVLVENLAFGYEGTRMAERAPVRPSLGKVKPIFAGQLGQLTFDVELKGSGAAGTAPELGPLLTGCGFSETIVAVTSVTYKHASSGHTSLTFYFFEDGLRYIMTGARGSVSLSLQTGATGKLSFTFVGHIASPTDVALAVPTYSAIVPAPVIAGAFSLDSYSAIISKLDVDWGIEVAKPDNLSAADGYGQIQITGRNVTGSVDPQATLVAAYDWIAKWKSSAAYALTTGTIGAAAGNRYAVTMPAVTYTEINAGDHEGILTRELKFVAAESAGDDEVSLAFT